MSHQGSSPEGAKRHQCGYTFDCPDLRSADSTDAPSPDSIRLAVDATAASLRGGEMLSVGGDLGTFRALKNVRGRFHG